MLFGRKCGVLGAIIGALVVMPLPNSFFTVQAQDKCTKQLAEADQKYYAGRFDEAIELATECINRSDISEADKLRAYKAIGLAYIAKDYLEQAKIAVRKLLELVPTYEPDLDQDPPQFTNMLKEVKQALEQEKKKQEEAKQQMVSKEPVVQMPPVKKGGGKTWLFIGGGAVAGAVVYFATRPDKNTPPPRLPLPPDPPN